MGEVQWGPPLIVLAVGAALGLLLVWRIRSSPAAPPAPTADLEVGDLEARREALIRQLRELEDAPRDEPERVARERYRLELEAAEVLRQLDLREPAPAAAPEAAEAPAATPAPAAAEPQPASALGGFLWGVGSGVAIGLLLFAVSRDASEREEGGSVTGNLPGETGGAPPPRAAAAPDAELRQLLEAVERSPDDLEARLALAQAHLMRQDLMSVYQETQFVLERRPEDPRALSYQSLVRLAMGQPELAVEMLRKALEVEPDYLEAYVHLALVQTQTGDPEGAEATVAEAGRRHPDQAPMLERLLGEMRRASAEAPPMPAGTHPDVAPRPDADAPSRVAPPAAAATAPAGATGFSGTIRLDPAAGPLPPGAVIYVYVREDGYTTGAPNAVKRLSPGSLPVAFQITPADTMMGGELPESARLEARVDRDGDVSTRDPADPVAVLEGVPIGSTAIELVLRVEP